MALQKTECIEQLSFHHIQLNLSPKSHVRSKVHFCVYKKLPPCLFQTGQKSQTPCLGTGMQA